MNLQACTREDARAIVQSLNTYNLSRVAAQSDTWTPLEYVAKDPDGKIVGGILAGIGYWQGLEIRVLWVDEAYRNQGYGSQLLRLVEDTARSKEATVAMLDTFDFQAERFYRKHGYEEVGRIEDFPPGHQRIYFSKRLTH